MESLLLVVLYLSPSWGTAGYVYVRKDAIIENVKGKVMESVLPNIGGGIGAMIPEFTGPAAPLMSPTEDAPAVANPSVGIPNFLKVEPIKPIGIP